MRASVGEWRGGGDKWAQKKGVRANARHPTGVIPGKPAPAMAGVPGTHRTTRAVDAPFAT